MKRYLVMAICIGLLICMVLIVIIIGAFLPPGMVDPYTHEVRFISDGFKVCAAFSAPPPLSLSLSLSPSPF